MNRKYCILPILLLSVITAGQTKETASKLTDEKIIAEDFPQELVDFIPYHGNPIFTGTDKDTWDHNIRERGYILREGDNYYMWYTGYNDSISDTKYLGYATSADGLTWTRYPENPIFNESWVEDVFVVKDGDVYYMFAEGRNDIAHLLTSTDRVHWQDHGSLDIRYTSGQPLTPGPYGTLTIWIESKTWYLFYERDDLAVWLASSTDRKVWTNIQDEPVLSPGPQAYDGKLIALDHIIKYKDRYYAYYHGIGPGDNGQEWGSWSASVAVSTDLIHWKKYPNNPIVTANSPILVHDGRQYRLYTMHPDVRVYFPKDSQQEKPTLLAPNAKVEKLAGGFKFTEGPAADANGNIFFSDITNNRIHKWSLDGTLSTFREDSGGANGLFFDKKGNLLACEGGRRRIVSIDAKGNVTVLADKYDNKQFNSPNDLWLDPQGGVYFTDPYYGPPTDLEQKGQYVYYLSPDRKKLIRVIDDLLKPNGIIGTLDGKSLYVTDHGGDKTFIYTINPDGTLSDKKLFAAESSDGMTIDNIGNIYLTSMPAATLSHYDTGPNPVSVYNSKGEKIAAILIPERPANVCFGGPDKQTLFITAQTSLYAVKMRVKGL